MSCAEIPSCDQCECEMMLFSYLCGHATYLCPQCGMEVNDEGMVIQDPVEDDFDIVFPDESDMEIIISLDELLVQEEQANESFEKPSEKDE